jgi:hypothetical protein
VHSFSPCEGSREGGLHARPRAKQAVDPQRPQPARQPAQRPAAAGQQVAPQPQRAQLEAALQRVRHARQQARLRVGRLHRQQKALFPRAPCS